MHLLYGAPPPDLAPHSADALQVSPLHLGSSPLEECAEASADSFTLLAPPGTIERRYTLALALRALRPGAELLALAPKDKGGSRLSGELEKFGAEVSEDSKRHHRICRLKKGALNHAVLAEAIEAGRPRFDAALNAWTQPGVFSWDRLDGGSKLLLEKLPALKGRGADLGAGLGFLTRGILERSPEVKNVQLVELDRRSAELAAKNVDLKRATVHRADVRFLPPEMGRLDFVVTNPPFHDGGAEDRTLGLSFLSVAASLLRPGAPAWIVANRHLPYEAALAESFTRSEVVAETGGFKIFRAEK